MTKSPEEFRLCFDPAEIEALAERYDVTGDDDALAAGRRIAEGNYDIFNLHIIFRWKTRGRGRSRLDRNEPREIRDALRLATAAKTERSAVAVLTGLYGVAVPVASAVLTVVDPTRYTIIDFRALESLRCDTLDRSIEFYLRYLAYCRDLAKQCGVKLRLLDRALWQASKERAQQRGEVVKPGREGL